MIHIPKHRLYVYASTRSILFKGLVDTPLFSEITKGGFEEINIPSGRILRLRPDGSVAQESFCYTDYSYYGNSHWWDYGRTPNAVHEEGDYMSDLIEIAKYNGITEQEIEALFEQGFTPEEIEEYIYCA